MKYAQLESNLRKQIDLELSSVGVGRQEIDACFIRFQDSGGEQEAGSGRPTVDHSPQFTTPYPRRQAPKF